MEGFISVELASVAKLPVELDEPIHKSFIHLEKYDTLLMFSFNSMQIECKYENNQFGLISSYIVLKVVGSFH